MFVGRGRLAFLHMVMQGSRFLLFCESTMSSDFQVINATPLLKQKREEWEAFVDHQPWRWCNITYAWVPFSWNSENGYMKCEETYKCGFSLGSHLPVTTVHVCWSNHKVLVAGSCFCHTWKKRFG